MHADTPERPNRLRTATAELLSTANRWLVLAVVALTGTLVVWSLASPMGSSPDDGFHLASILCGGAEKAGVCEPADGLAVKVPQAAATAPCFAFDPTVSGTCQIPRYSYAAAQLVGTEAHNTGFYPPVYYGVNSVFGSSDPYFTSAAVRLLNILIHVVLVSVSLLVAPTGLRRLLLAVQAVVVAPLGLFVIASTNPSAWAFTSISLFWFVLVVHLSPENRRNRLTAVLLVVLALLGAGARSDSVVWLVLTIGLVALLGPERRKLVTSDVVTGAALMLVAGFSILSSGQDEMGRGGLDKVRDVSAIDLHFANLGEVLRISLGAVGPSPLGWLDTPMTSLTTILGPAVLLSIVTLALARRPLRGQLAIGAGAAIMVATPMYMLWQGNYIVGEAIQARYFMPMLAAVVGIAVVPTGDFRLSLSPAHRVAFTIGLGLSHALAFHTHIRRYTSGLDVGGLDLNTSVEWWFTARTVAQPMTVWAVTSILFTVFVWFALSPTIERTDVADSAVLEEATS